MMVKLYWMIGISGSGKSTMAEKIAKEENAYIIASDKIRKELYGDEKTQGNPEEVFNTVYDRIINYLKLGKNVVFDATNISLKHRHELFKNLKQNYINPKNIAVVLTTPISVCYGQNILRGRVVPEHVIERQYHNFNIPFFEEGFDEIILDEWFDNKPITKEDITSYSKFNYENLLSILDIMFNFDQKNPHHQFTLGKHCIEIYKRLKEYSDDKSLLSAALVHDIGKLKTQTFSKKGIAHYYQHANVGCYELLQNLDIFSLSPFEIIRALTYVNYHMFPFDWKCGKTKEKYNRIFGNEIFNNLILLNKIDRECSID